MAQQNKIEEEKKYKQMLKDYFDGKGRIYDLLSFFDFYGRKGQLKREHVDEMNDLGKHIITEKPPTPSAVQITEEDDSLLID